MATIASLVVRIAAETSQFQEAMASSVKATRDTQLAMEQSSAAVTALEARMRSLRQAYNLGVLSQQEFSEAARTVKADVAELATQAQLTEGSQARLASVGGSASRAMRVGATAVQEAGVATEHATSRIAFGMAMMARSGELGGRSLRGVEFGLMSLLPGLGWGLVGITALIEGMSLLSDRAEKTRKSFADFLAANRSARFEISDNVTHVQALTARLAELQAGLERFRSGGTLLGWFPRFAESIGWGNQQERAEGQIEQIQAVLAFNRAMQMSASAHGLTKDAARTIDDTRSATEKYQDRVAQLRRELRGHLIDQEVFNRAVAAAREEMIRASRTHDEHAQRIRSLISSLEQQRDTFGRLRAEVELYQLRVAGATAAEIAYAQAIVGTIARLEKAKQAEEDRRKAVAEAEREIARKREEADRDRQRSSEESTRSWTQGLEAQKRAAEKHTEDVKRVFRSLFEDLSRGDWRAALNQLGELAIGRLMAASQDVKANAANGLSVPAIASRFQPWDLRSWTAPELRTMPAPGAVPTDLPGKLPPISRLTGSARAVASSPLASPFLVLPERSEPFRIGGSSGRSVTPMGGVAGSVGGAVFQSGMNVTIQSLDARTTTDLLKKHMPTIADMVVRQITRDKRLTDVLQGNQ